MIELLGLLTRFGVIVAFIMIVTLIFKHTA